MTTEELHEVFRKIANGHGRHGSFLRAFADAFVRADAGNEELLKGSAEALVTKYNLSDYAHVPDEAVTE